MSTTLIANFLAGYGRNTARAYGNDLADWESYFCDDLLTATRADVDGYLRHLESTGRSASTIARRVASISGLYRYAMSEDLIARNPCEFVRRPKVSDQSQTLGLDQHEARALLRAAQVDSPRSYALVSLLLHTACRVGEALALDVEDFGIDGGHQVVRIHGKGGKIRVIPVSGTAVADYLDGRDSGPVFVTRSGARWDQPGTFRLIQRLAVAAGIRNAHRITPHSLRHSAISAALAVGSPIHEVQDLAGHSSPAMTQRYNRARYHVSNSPAFALTEYFAV